MTSLRAATLRQAMQRASTSSLRSRPPRRSRGRRARAIAGTRGSPPGGARQALPAGLLKLRRLVDEGSSAAILSLRGSSAMGLRGDVQSAQRPSWNYRKGRRRHDHGHVLPRNYVLEGIIGTVKSVAATAVTHIRPAGTSRVRPTRRPRTTGRRVVRDGDTRWRQGGRPDQPPGGGGVRANWWSSDRRHPRFGGGRLEQMLAQQRAHTPKPVWNPDCRSPSRSAPSGPEVPATPISTTGSSPVGGVPPRRGRRAGAPVSACCRRPAASQLAELGLQPRLSGAPSTSGDRAVTPCTSGG